MKKRHKILGLLLVLTLCLFTGCSLFSDTSSSLSPSVPTTPKEKISLDTTSLQSEVTHIFDNTYSITITGVAKNVSGKQLSYVSITFTLFDSDGNQIGIAIDNTANLTNGTTWKFSAYGTTTGAPATFRVSDITAF